MAAHGMNWAMARCLQNLLRIHPVELAEVQSWGRDDNHARGLNVPRRIRDLGAGRRFTILKITVRCNAIGSEPLDGKKNRDAIVDRPAQPACTWRTDWSGDW